MNERFEGTVGELIREPRLREAFSACIDGALSFGFLNIEPPPAAHWLEVWWQKGRTIAEGFPNASPAPRWLRPVPPPPPEVANGQSLKVALLVRGPKGLFVGVDWWDYLLGTWAFHGGEKFAAYEVLAWCPLPAPTEEPFA